MEFAPVSPPDLDAAAAARARTDATAGPVGALGRLEDLSVWLAGCQGCYPPRQFERARVVVFDADSGVAEGGTVEYPGEPVRRPASTVTDGRTPVIALAGVAGVGVRVVDLTAIRRRTGDTGVEDPLTAAQTVAAVATGRRVVDEEVDRGADLLITGATDIENLTAATTLVAAVTGVEPVRLVGYGSGLDDTGWTHRVAAVRDALFRCRSAVTDPLMLLSCCGSVDLAALAGFCAQAAIRRTPLLLDGPAVLAAALIADRLAPGARQWWQAGHLSTEPAHPIALSELSLDPILDLGIRLDDGSGAVLALSVLRSAVAASAVSARG